MDSQLYRSLYRIRRVEEEIARAYPSDCIKSPVHLSIGQEAVSVGVCAALDPEDIVYGSYRGHALYLAKGGSMGAMVAELFGKATGCTGGKGGFVTAHLAVDYAGAAKLGDWVESSVEIQRMGTRLAFANCYLVAGGKRIVRASAIFARAEKEA